MFRLRLTHILLLFAASSVGATSHGVTSPRLLEVGGKTYRVYEEIDAGKVLRQQVIVGPAYTELYVDGNGDGIPEHWDVTEGQETYRMTYPSGDKFLRVVYEKESSEGVQYHAFDYDRRQDRYVLVKSEFHKHTVMNASQEPRAPEGRPRNQQRGRAPAPSSGGQTAQSVLFTPSRDIPSIRNEPYAQAFRLTTSNSPNSPNSPKGLSPEAAAALRESPGGSAPQAPSQFRVPTMLEFNGQRYTGWRSPGGVCLEKSDPLYGVVQEWDRIRRDLEVGNEREAADQIACAIRRNQNLFFDRSCLEGDFYPESFNELVAGMSDVLASGRNSVWKSSGTEGIGRYMTCLDNRGLRYHSARMQAHFLRYMSERANDMVGQGAANGSCEPIASQRTAASASLTRPFTCPVDPNGQEVASWDRSRYQMSFFARRDRMATITPGDGTRLNAREAYASVFFHELIHASGIENERLAYALQWCCAGGNPDSHPACLQARSMLNDDAVVKEYRTQLEKLPGFMPIDQQLRASIGDDLYNPLMVGFYSEFHEKNLAAQAVYQECRSNGDAAACSNRFNETLANFTKEYFARPNTCSALAAFARRDSSQINCTQIGERLASVFPTRVPSEPAQVVQQAQQQIVNLGQAGQRIREENLTRPGGGAPPSPPSRFALGPPQDTLVNGPTNSVGGETGGRRDPSRRSLERAQERMARREQSRPRPLQELGPAAATRTLSGRVDEGRSRFQALTDALIPRAGAVGPSETSGSRMASGPSNRASAPGSIGGSGSIRASFSGAVFPPVPNFEISRASVAGGGAAIQGGPPQSALASQGAAAAPVVRSPAGRVQRGETVSAPPPSTNQQQRSAGLATAGATAGRSGAADRRREELPDGIPEGLWRTLTGSYIRFNAILTDPVRGPALRRELRDLRIDVTTQANARIGYLGSDARFRLSYCRPENALTLVGECR